MPDAIYATYILYLYTHRKKMPRFKPSWTKRKKGGHMSAAKVQNVQTGAAVSTEVAEDLVCQSTAEDLVCQSTAEEDDPVVPSIVSLPKRVTVQTFLQGSQNVHKSSAIVVALCRHLVQKSLLRRHVTCTTLVQLPARVASPVPSCVYDTTYRPYHIPQRKAKAEELIELVVSHLKVAERDYFGIYYAVRDQRVGVL